MHIGLGLCSKPMFFLSYRKILNNLIDMGKNTIFVKEYGN